MIRTIRATGMGVGEKPIGKERGGRENDGMLWVLWSVGINFADLPV